MTNVVLSFETHETRLVEIAGARYPLRSREDFSLGQAFRYERLIAAATPLIQAAGERALTDEEDAALSRHISDLAELALDAPRAVIEQLRSDQRMVLVSTAFFASAAPRDPAPLAQPARSRPARRRGGRR
jgi:hypothetical protein